MVAVLQMVLATAHDCCVVPRLLAMNMVDSSHSAEHIGGVVRGLEVAHHAVDVGLKDVAMHAQLVGNGKFLGDMKAQESWKLLREG